MNKRFFLLVCLLWALTGQSCCFGELIKGLDFYGRWPDMSQRAAALDPDRGLLFLADGNILTALSMDTLTPVSRLALAVKTGVRGVAIAPKSHDYLYAACGNDGLMVIDVRNAENMSVTAALSSVMNADLVEDPVYGAGIACLEARVMVADLFFGLRVFNVADPANPFQESAYEQVSVNAEGDIFSGGYENLAVAAINGRDLAFVLDKYYGMRAFDIQAAAVSHLADYPPVPDTSALYDTKPVTDIAVMDNRYAVIADYENGLLTLDLFSDTADPTALKMTPASYFETPGAASGIAVAGRRVYVADGNSGLLVVNLADPKNPAAAGTFATAGAHSVLAFGVTAFLSDAEAGLRRINAENPAAPVMTHRFDTPSDADGVVVAEDRIYTLDNDGPDEGLRVIRMSDTGESALLGFCKTPGNATRMQVAGGFAYIADGPAGLTVVHISDPANPAVVFTASGASPVQNAVDIALSSDGKLAYLGDAAGRVAVFDLAVPGSPVQIASLEAGDAIRGLSGFAPETGRYLCAAGPEGLSVAEVSDPTAAMVLATLDTPGECRDVFVLNDYAYVADGAAGLTLANLARPDRPGVLATRNLAGDCQAVFADGVYAHCVKGEAGITVIGVSDEAPPKLTFVAETDTPGYAGDVFVAGNDDGRYTFVADTGGGVLIFKHNDQYAGGVDEQPFTNTTHDRGWDRVSCFISTLLE